MHPDRLHVLVRARNLILAALIVCLWAPARSDDLVLPKDLVAIAKENNCSELKDYYDRPGMVQPPYAYSSGERSSAAVFWCKKNQPDERPYLLLFTPGKGALNRECASKLDWWNRPRGLIVGNSIRLPLKGFSYFDRPDHEVAEDGSAAGALVIDTYDGLTTYFYCHRGQWVFETRD